MRSLVLFFLVSMTWKLLFVQGEVIFTEEPEKHRTVTSGSKIPDMVWKHNGSDMNVIMNITIYYSGGQHEQLAEKIYNNSWKVKAEGMIDVKDQATLTFPFRLTGSFNAIIEMVLGCPHQGSRNSSVDLIVQGTGFTREPSRIIMITIGSNIPNLVWKHNESHKNVLIEITFTPHGNKTQREIARKPWGTTTWDRMSSEMNIKDQATLVINNTATKYDGGVYTMKLKGRLVLHEIQQSNVSLIIQDKQRINNKDLIAVVVAVPVCAVFLVAWMFILWYKRRNRIRYEAHGRFNNVDYCPDEIYWDVFISYSSKDFLWVKHFCETLEQPPFDLDVCLHQRDWEIGRTVIDNMADSVYCSGKTLIIMSKNYLESRYCMQELQIAMHREIGSRNSSKATIVLIVIDASVSLKKLPKALRQKSFLDFSNTEHRKHFKTQLLKVLPARRELADVANETYEMDCRQ